MFGRAWCQDRAQTWCSRSTRRRTVEPSQVLGWLQGRDNDASRQWCCGVHGRTLHFRNQSNGCLCSWRDEFHDSRKEKRNCKAKKLSAQVFVFLPFWHWTTLRSPNYWTECSPVSSRCASACSHAKTSPSSIIGTRCDGLAPLDKARNCFLAAWSKKCPNCHWKSKAKVEAATNQKVKNAEAQHFECNARVSVIIEPIQNLDA